MEITIFVCKIVHEAVFEHENLTGQCTYLRDKLLGRYFFFARGKLLQRIVPEQAKLDDEQYSSPQSDTVILPIRTRPICRTSYFSKPKTCK